MSEMPKESVAVVIGALEEYLQRIIQTAQFDLQDFMNFMEPKFASAGYRAPAPPHCDGGNVLIIHDCGAGDFIVQSPLIREVRRVYPDAYISLVVATNAFELAECCPYVDEVIYNRRQFYINLGFAERYNEIFTLAKQLLQRRIDVAYAVCHHPYTPLLMYMSGARTRLTHRISDDDKETFWCQDYDLPRNYMTHLATQTFPLRGYGSHAVDICLSLLDCTLYAPVANRDIEVWYTALEMNTARQILRDVSRPIYALCMGGSGSNKRYPPEKYARLLEMIAVEEPVSTFVILGGGQSDLISAEILKNTAPEIYEKNILDLTNRINYRQTAAILKLCNMYIGNDTGTMHIAEALKVPVLIPRTFPADLPSHSNDNHRIWYPYRIPSVTVQPAHALPECVVNSPYNHFGCRSPEPHCITQITPEKIFEGFHFLKKRIVENNIEPLYIY